MGIAHLLQMTSKVDKTNGKTVFKYWAIGNTALWALRKWKQTIWFLHVPWIFIGRQFQVYFTGMWKPGDRGPSNGLKQHLIWISMQALAIVPLLSSIQRKKVIKFSSQLFPQGKTNWSTLSSTPTCLPASERTGF